MDRSLQLPFSASRRFFCAVSICLSSLVFSAHVPALEPVSSERGEKAWSEKVAPTVALPPMVPFRELLPKLKHGGYVFYIRHPATETKDLGSGPVNHERCEGQRNLSPAGEAHAKLIGRAFRKLGIPVDGIIVSPSCRTRDTARLLAFDRYTVNPDLDYALRVTEEASIRLATSLRTMLSTRPPTGKNTILIGHSGNLREAIGIFPKPEGVSFIFHPGGDGRYEIVGKMTPEDWAKAAGLPTSDEKH